MDGKIKEFCESLAKALPATLNALALGEFDITLVPAVERDTDGISTAWRIFKYGRNELYKNGEKYYLDFSEEVFDAIISHFRDKGHQIPLDSHHWLYRLAEYYGVTETEILKVLPDGQGTFGFGDLEKRTDGLWITNIKYVPLARKLMADGSFRYFSPVIRGLSDGRFRVTSVTMENVPAMSNLSSLAAAEDLEEKGCRNLEDITSKLDVIAASAENKSTTHQNKEKSMKNLLIAIAGLFGMDSIALGENDEAPKDVLDKVKALGIELPQLRAQKTADDALLKDFRSSLALGEDADHKSIQAAFKGILTKAEQHDALKNDVDALKLSAESDKKQKLIEQGMAAGKLTQGQVDGWVKGLDSVALSAFLQHAPAVVPVKPLDKKNLDNPDSVSLSEEDKDAAKLLGISEEDMLKSKKENSK